MFVVAECFLETDSILAISFLKATFSSFPIISFLRLCVRLVYLRVRETFFGGSGSADDSDEVRASSVGGECVALSAEGLEDLLTFTSITSDLLLWGHFKKFTNKIIY
jgi:hypothetical protein